MPALRLSAIPVPIRAAAYSLPLFIGWIIPLTWEDDARLIRAGRRALAALLLYVAGIGATYLLSGLIQLVVVNPGYVVNLLFFILRAGSGLAYLFFSLWMAYAEYQGRPLDSRSVYEKSAVVFLDRSADKFEKIVSR